MPGPFRAHGSGIVVAAALAAATACARPGISTGAHVADEAPAPRPPYARTTTPAAAAAPSASPAAVPTPSPTPVSPSRTEADSFVSQALGTQMRYVAYLPAGYDSSPTQRYPVLYMLHGVGGPETEWQTDGLLDAADRLISAGQISPLIIVLPEGDQSFWIDEADGGPEYGTYTAQDVVAEIDGNFRTIPDAAHRAIGGLSMGADGALQVAINFPGTYSVVGGHSPTPHMLDQLPSFFGDEAWYEAHDFVHLFAQHPEIARTLQIWMDIGTQDSDWRARDEAFHQQLLSEGIPHEWQDRWPGKHESSYWASHVEDYLRFYDRALKATAASSQVTP